MEEHRDVNYRTDRSKKQGWWSCQRCGCGHFQGEDFCDGCGTAQAAAMQEPPGRVLEPPWREKEEKRRAAEAAYREWCDAGGVNREHRSLLDRISPARRAEQKQKLAKRKAKKAAYYRASAVLREAGRKYRNALLRWQYDWATSAANAKTILGVATNASEEEIKSAYRRAVKLYHPDRANENGLTVKEATRAFQQIQEAYDVLCSVFVQRP